MRLRVVIRVKWYNITCLESQEIMSSSLGCNLWFLRYRKTVHSFSISNSTQFVVKIYLMYVKGLVWDSFVGWEKKNAFFHDHCLTPGTGLWLKVPGVWAILDESERASEWFYLWKGKNVSVPRLGKSGAIVDSMVAPQKVCLSLDPWNLWMWPHLEKGSL